VVGDKGLVLHWDGSELTRVPVRTQSQLSAVAGFGREEVVVVGSDGTVLRRGR
jgi:hypothetical protein